MPRCSGSKPDGSPCQRIVSPSQTYCHAHDDPSRSERRRRAASKAAKSKPNQEVAAAIKQRLKDLTDDVLEGRVGRADAAVVGQIYNVVLRTMEAERKIREQEELIERLEELEGAKELREQVDR